ncbi:hypothetical protein QJS66_03650 [Kocuria rhizophila]|nr:hypothetical protein QJS66_03650 [Kocuria rhizophila]
MTAAALGTTVTLETSTAPAAWPWSPEPRVRCRRDPRRAPA